LPDLAEEHHERLLMKAVGLVEEDDQFLVQGHAQAVQHGLHHADWGGHERIAVKRANQLA
jgi:hypothetical protein